MSTHKTRPDYIRHRGDSYLPIDATFRGESDRPTDDGDPLDLSDALSVRFYLTHTEREETIVNDTATINDAATGSVSYQLDKHQLARTGTHAGLFIARFEGEQQWSAPRGGRVIRVEVEDIPDADGEPIDLEKVDVSIGVLEADEVIADSGSFGELSASSAPTAETDVVREAERQALASDIGTLGQEKADRVGDNLEMASATVSNAPSEDTDSVRLVDLPVADVRFSGAEGDGSTDDTDAVAAAISAAGDNSRIWFPEGRYNVTGVNIHGLDNVTLGGPGTLVATDSGRTISVENSTDVTIRVNVDADLVADSCVFFDEGCENVLVENAYIQQSDTGNLVDFNTGTSGGTVRNCRLEEAGRTAVVVYEDNRDITVENCRISGWMRRRDLDDGAVDCYGYNNENISVKGNYIDTTTTGPSTNGRHTPIRIQQAKHVDISGNVARLRSPDCFVAWQTGQRSDATDPYSDDVTVRDNTWIVDVGITRGFRIDGCDRLTVDNNDWIINTTDVPYKLMDIRTEDNGNITVKNEHVRDLLTDGMFLAVHPDATVSRLQVKGNNVRANRELVTVDGGVANLSVQDNDYSQPSGSPTTGAVSGLSNVEYARILGNYFQTAAADYLGGTPTEDLIDNSNHGVQS